MEEEASRIVTEPVQAAERIHALDLIRGFALLGVLLGNINSSLPQPMTAIFLGFTDNPTSADIAVEWFAGIFVDSKFYTMFSLLFGAGFVIFLDRAKARNAPANVLFLRRLGALLLIGLAHGLLIWYGDILVTYAVAGTALLLFANIPSNRLWKWGVVIHLLPIVWFWISWLLSLIAPAQDAGAAAAVREARLATAELDALIYTTGNWWEVAQQRFSDLLLAWRYILPGYGVPALGMFLIGASIARSGLLTSLDSHRPLLRRMAFFGFIIGIPLAAYAQVAFANGWFLSRTAYRLGAMLVCLAYVAALALLMQRERILRWLKLFSPVGRMALTNYLLQSLIFTWIFCGYGLGIGDSLGRAVTNVMALAFFGLQIVFSSWWLAHYRFGPMEWVWRTITYGRVQPLRISRPANV